MPGPASLKCYKSITPTIGQPAFSPRGERMRRNSHCAWSWCPGCRACLPRAPCCWPALCWGREFPEAALPPSSVPWWWQRPSPGSGAWAVRRVSLRRGSRAPGLWGPLLLTVLGTVLGGHTQPSRGALQPPLPAVLFKRISDGCIIRLRVFCLFQRGINYLRIK